MKQYQLAYVSRLIYPDPAANAVQTIQMAAAFAECSGQTELFVHDLTASERQVRRQYAIDVSPLKIRSMGAKRWPAPMYDHGRARFVLYNLAVASWLTLNPVWWSSGRHNILYVRSRLEILFWGLLRPYLWWLRNWTFVCEVHDLPNSHATSPDHPPEAGSSRVVRMTRALCNYDLLLAVTKSLADDIQTVTAGAAEVHVMPLCSGLPRLERAPQVSFSANRVILGYVGSIDSAHGIDDLLRALAALPNACQLRLIGHVHDEAKAWIDNWLSDPERARKIVLVPPVAYAQVQEQIDACDILLAPAGNTRHAKRYRSPLKLFDYMVRGKPIVAASVPCHCELLQDGINACLYRPGDPEDLAACITTLLRQPQRATTIARGAWEMSRHFTYTSRAKRILDMMTSVHP